MAIKVFISYSWTDDEYISSVLQLAKDLRHDGVDVILDQWDLKAGHDRFEFMEQSIEQADKVLILCDHAYADKANGREGGVGVETVIITPDVYGNSKQEKFIPVVMDSFDNLPKYLKSRIAVDCRPGKRKSGYDDLLRLIYDKPVHVKPELGEKPKWLDQPTLDNKMNMFAELYDGVNGDDDANKEEDVTFDTNAAKKQFYEEVFGKKPHIDIHDSQEEKTGNHKSSSLGKENDRDPFVDELLKAELSKKSAAERKVTEELKAKAEKEEKFLRLQNQIISKIYNPLKEMVDSFNRNSSSGSISLSPIDTDLNSEIFSFEYATVDVTSKERRTISFEYYVPHSEIKSIGSAYRPVVGLTPKDSFYSGNGDIDYRAVDYRYYKDKILMWGTICADCGVGISVGILNNPVDSLYGKVKMFYLVPLIEGYNFYFPISDERLKKYCVSGFREMRYDIKVEDFNFDEIKAMIKMNDVFSVDQITDPIEQERNSLFGF